MKQLFSATGIELTATCTEVETMKTKYLNHKTTPNLPVFKAIRTSMTYPFVYKPVKMTPENPTDTHVGQGYMTYIDGGVLQNFPLDFFDYDAENKVHRNPYTVGLMLVPGKKEEDKQLLTLTQKKLTLTSFISNLLEGVIDQANAISFHREANISNCYKRIIEISTSDVETLDFTIGVGKKEELITNGYIGMRNFFGEFQFVE